MSGPVLSFGDFWIDVHARAMEGVWLEILVLNRLNQRVLLKREQAKLLGEALLRAAGEKVP